MTRVTVLYPASSKFDFDYYLTSHTPMVERLGAPLGLRPISVDRCLSSLGGGPSPYACIATMLFENDDALGALLTAHGGEILADIPNYTDSQPVIVVGQVER
jgi:uncharacterized protein (TIGR02118 family)